MGVWHLRLYRQNWGLCAMLCNPAVLLQAVPAPLALHFICSQLVVQHQSNIDATSSDAHTCRHMSHGYAALLQAYGGPVIFAQSDAVHVTCDALCLMR